ncbi:hypothetical protein RFI_36491, partial [Reticulomyxa filosa]
GKDEGSGGYGTKGDYGQGGEETLLRSEGGSGSEYGGSGGIIELIIKQQLINHGSIQSYEGFSLGSGGSILIELQYQSHLDKLEQTFGTITCIGGGGKGRINNILKMDPKPLIGSQIISFFQFFE